MQLRLAVFASGGGSNFRAILQSDRSYEVVLCVSNRTRCGALGIAKEHGTPTCVMNPKGFTDEAAYVHALMEVLHKHEVNFIALAGYLRKIPAAVVAAFSNRILNIHPALLPAFGGKGLYGMRVHKAVLHSGVPVTGATVHFVDEQYDTGPILLQSKVPVKRGDTAQTLADRVLREEHLLYPKALSLINSGRVTVSGQNVTIHPIVC